MWFQRSIIRAAILFRLDTDPPVQLWSGVGDLEVPADAVQPVKGLYLGAGELQGMPDLQQLINGAADRVEFTLSGFDAAALALFDAESSVRGRRINIGAMPLDDSWQQAAPVLWVWEGEADVPMLSETADGDKRTRSITLSAGSAMTGRRRPKSAFFSDADQRRRSPDDAFCQRVGLYISSYPKTWPRF